MVKINRLKFAVTLLALFAFLVSAGSAQAAQRLTYPLFKAFDSNSDVLSGGKLFTYEPGTTTKKTTYQDSAETTPHTNPIVLDSLGEKEIFINGATKLVLTTADDSDPPTSPIWTKNSVLPASEAIVYVDTLADLKALPAQATDGVMVYLSGRTTAGDGGEGHFRWDSSDQSANVTADTLSGIYVPPDSDATGASGAWVRVYNGPVYPEWYGAVGGLNGTDNGITIQAIYDGLDAGTVLLSQFYEIQTPLVFDRKKIDIVGIGFTRSGFITNVGATEVAVSFGIESSDARVSQSTFRDWSVVGADDTCLNGIYMWRPVKSIFKNIIVCTGSAAEGIIVEGAIGADFDYFGVDSISTALPDGVGTIDLPQGDGVIFRDGTTFPSNSVNIGRLLGRSSGGVGVTITSDFTTNPAAGLDIKSMYVEANAGRGFILEYTRATIIHGVWSEGNGNLANLIKGNYGCKINSYSPGSAMEFVDDRHSELTGNANEISIDAGSTGTILGAVRHSFNHPIDVFGGGIQDAGTYTHYVGPIGEADGGSPVYTRFSKDWTPALTFGGAATGITYSTQAGRAVREGNIMYLSINLGLTSAGTATGTNSISIPYAPANGIAVAAIKAFNISITSGTIVASVAAGASSVQLQQVSDSGVVTSLADTNFDDDARVQINLSYEIDPLLTP